MIRLLLLPLVLLPLLFLVPACRQIQLKPIESEPHLSVKLGDEFEYYDYLRSKPRASTADGARLLALTYGKYPWSKEMKALKEILLEQKVIKKEWEISEAAPLTAGKIAFMICYSIPIKTSLIMAMTVPSERYSLRELVFHEIMSPSGIYRYISGTELLDIFARAESFRRDFSVE